MTGRYDRDVSASFIENLSASLIESFTTSNTRSCGDEMEVQKQRLAEITDVVQVLRQWEEEYQTPGYNPVPILTRLSELVETETENYLKMDPDPFDQRHPSRADPECALGHMLKVLFRKDIFMTRLINDYLRDNYYSRNRNLTTDSRELNIAACRLILDILPGLEITAVFQVPENETLIMRFFTWAEKADEPLRSYATGLLAATMEVQEIATNFRDQNARLVPLKLKELRKLQLKSAEDRQSKSASVSSRPFAHLGSVKHDIDVKNGTFTKKRHNGNFDSVSPLNSPPLFSPPPPELVADVEVQVNGIDHSPPRKKCKSSDDEDSRLEGSKGASCDYRNDSCVMSPPSVKNSSVPHNHMSSNAVGLNECSSSSWAEMEPYVIGNIQMHPQTISTRQILILRYLTPMGEYQEFLGHVFEHNALDLILKYTNLRESKNSRLAFEALKYLAALLCHKKFSIEFINMKGLPVLLTVPRPSVAATGVSICLYYLAYCEDAMERICQMSHSMISDLVRYGLWLLECSHDSGRCHATMFFGLTFQFRAILAEFDAQDGLRKMYNVISTLPILSLEFETQLNEDEEAAARQVVRHVCVALKKYFDSHLCMKAEHLRRTQIRETGGYLEPSVPSMKLKCKPEEIQEHTQILLDLMPFRSHWEPVDELLRLGGITLLLQAVAFAYEWNYSGRAETVRSALDVLAVCSVMPRVQLLLCERVDLPDESVTVGMNIILGAAEGEIVSDPDVQRSALSVLINCVCAPIQRVGGTVGRFSFVTPSKKKTSVKCSEDLITKMWESVRSNNGIMVLLQLMMNKVPITDADSIRAMACRALAGLARSDTVRQIVSKLPLFTNGKLQMLMRDPILQDKRQEHVSFQKYALELMEMISGKPKSSGSDLDIASIHRANVVAQTRINYNDKQLNLLIHHHLLSRGLVETASVLQKEANLPVSAPRQSLSHHRLHLTPVSTSRVRHSSVSTAGHHHHRNVPSSQTLFSVSDETKVSLNGRPITESYSEQTLSAIPIKLNLANSKKNNSYNTISSGMNTYANNSSLPTSRSLQKQISSDLSSTSSLSPLLKSNITSSCCNSEARITLDSIITEYLTNQHALCKNPVVPCPQFNLFEPHRCPEPRTRNGASNNFASRFLSRHLQLGRNESFRLDRKLVHSRFYPVKTFRVSEDESYFTCCEFFIGPHDQYVFMGTYQGDVKMYSLTTGAEEATYQCHDSLVNHLQGSRDQYLLLTSSAWRRPLSVLWSISRFFETKMTFDDDEYVEFSKLTQDRVIGTKADIATIYDISVGKKLMTLTPTISNQYTGNKATFSPNDDMVLSDGVLWDVNSGKEIHKFDKLNQTLSGVFHPNGLEVLANTEVWDLRTFHLLRTVPSLDQSKVIFSPLGDTIYTIALEQETHEDKAFESSFKTLDAHDYSCISTIDVKKYIYDLACNQFDTQIAIVENQGLYDNMQESTVRLYDVGRRRDDEDEGGEDEEEEDDIDGSEDNSGSGSDDDNPDDNTTAENIEGAEADSENAENNNEDEEVEGEEEEETEENNASDNSSSSSEELLELADMEELEDILARFN